MTSSSASTISNSFQMVTAFGSMRWWTAADSSGDGHHKKGGFISFFLDSNDDYFISFEPSVGGNGFRLCLPPVSAWKEPPKSSKFYKESLLVDNCKLRSVLVSFNDDDILRIQLSFAIITNTYGIVTQDHGKLIHLAMTKAFNNIDGW